MKKNSKQPLYDKETGKVTDGVFEGFDASIEDGLLVIHVNPETIERRDKYLKELESDDSKDKKFRF